MAWSNSKIFRRAIQQMLGNNLAYDLESDDIKAALYNNTPTPNQDETTDALISYNGAASQWVAANEVTDATNWTAGGRSLVSQTVDAGTAGVVFFDANDTSGAGNVTISNAFGALVYDNTLATNKCGLCYNYFGGAQSVTAGAFTIIWHSSGIFRLTL